MKTLATSLVTLLCCGALSAKEIRRLRSTETVRAVPVSAKALTGSKVQDVHGVYEVHRIQAEKPVSSSSSSYRYLFSFGVPELAQIGVMAPLAPTTWFGLSLGGFAAKPFVPQLSETMESKVNDRYNVMLNPDANIFSTAVFVRYYPWRGRSFFDGKMQLFIADVSGKAAMKSVENGEVVSIGKVDVTFIQPISSLSYGYDFYQSENMCGNFTIGVSYFFPATVKSRITGPLPAFLNVAPEYREAIDDSSERAMNDITDLLNKTFDRYRFLPNLSVSVTW